MTYRRQAVNPSARTSGETNKKEPVSGTPVVGVEGPIFSQVREEFMHPAGESPASMTHPGVNPDRADLMGDVGRPVGVSEELGL